MNPEVVAFPPWGRSDFYTLIVGVPLKLFACYLHRKAVSACGSECAEMFLGMMSTALSRPPLIMILVDPFVRNFLPFVKINFFDVVVSEARLGLWCACLLAAIDGGLSRFRERKELL